MRIKTSVVGSAVRTGVGAPAKSRRSAQRTLRLLRGDRRYSVRVAQLRGPLPLPSLPTPAALRYNRGTYRGCNERPAMPLDWQPLVKLVDARQRFLLTTHIRPDGDALGSMLAMGEALRRRG